MSSYAGKNKGYDKEQHEMLAPEELVPMENYAFTLNPGGKDDSMQMLEANALRRFSDFKMHQRAYLMQVLAPYANYQFWIEISKKGRLHLHGVVKFHDYDAILGFFMKAVPNLMKCYSFCLKPIDNMSDWLVYCTKSERLFGDRIQHFDSKTPVPIIVGIDKWTYEDYKS